MSDILSKNSEDPDALPVNERSSAFIDGVAFLEFVRLKSLAGTESSNTATNGTTPVSAGEAADGSSNSPSNGQDHAVSHPQTTAQIDIEDWDSLFDAVEERLRDTVEKPDSATTPLAARDNASRIKLAVLDCVNALDKLHKALRQERSTHVPVATNGITSYAVVAPPLTNGHDTSQNN
jgi:hypothetical protein